MAKVLIVDDEVPLAQLLGEIVRDTGHQAWLAYNGREGLVLAQRERPDLVISDVMMPLMTGYELLCALRADPVLHHIYVVLTSAGAPPPPALAAAANQYLAKPFQLQAIEDLMGRFT